MSRTTAVLACAAGLAFAFADAARAQEYPNKPIRLVVTYAPEIGRAHV